MCICVNTLKPIPYLTKIFAKTRLLEASKRRGHIRLVVRVDKDCTGVQPLAYVEGFADVTCEHA